MTTLYPSSTAKTYFIKGYGVVCAAVSLFLFLISFAYTTFAGEDPYLAELIKAAEQKELYRERYWDVLLHYKQRLTGVESLIDDPAFFLSSDGKRDPKKEIEATLTAFFQDDRIDDTHPRCRFVARYEWLKEKLDIDESMLPVVLCTEFHQAYDKIKPKSAVLVFPTAYINGPASTFGHTLIRIDSDYESKLLSYAATYAAAADDKNGLLYAFKGIFGNYHGYFTILPYYEKIKEYSDLEQRDIWEYRLNLSEEEVSRMLLHLWELKDIYSYYYFFDENCSYTLLFLLEAARPSLHLTDRPGLWVIPVDTVRAMKDEHIVEAVEYRPSRGTKIRHVASLLDKMGQEFALKVANQDIDPGDYISSLDKDQKIKALDIAVELVQSRYNDKELDKEEYQKEFLKILKARSPLGKPNLDYDRILPSLRPDEGHGSSRLSLGLGYHDNELFQEIRYRAAQHELSDPDGGYLEGSEIVFFSVTARNIPDGSGPRLENVDIISIVSISPRDIFFKPISWKVKTGLLQKNMSDGDEELAYQLNPGGGFAFKSDLVGLYYFMIETDLNVAGGYRDNYSLGLGPSIGIIRNIIDSWKMNLYANAMYFELGDEHRAYKASLEQVFRVSRNNSLNLNLSWMRDFDVEQNEIKLNWNLYF